MQDELHIASLVIRSWPDAFDQVIDLAGKLPTAEVMNNESKDCLAVVFEATSETEISSIINQVQDWPGVLSAQLAYHHCEANDSLQEEIPDAIYTS